MDDENQIIGTSTIRGVVLLGGVALVAYLAFRYWMKIKASEQPAFQMPISIPVELPGRKPPQAVGFRR